jgi:leucine dehydrogenase
VRYLADINEEKMNEVGTIQCPNLEDDLYSADVDIYAPCAMGATINNDTVYKLKVIAGAANNQLADENVHGAILQERGILYAPDFLINAGGIINVYAELAHYESRNHA